MGIEMCLWDFRCEAKELSLRCWGELYDGLETAFER